MQTSLKISCVSIEWVTHAHILRCKLSAWLRWSSGREYQGALELSNLLSRWPATIVAPTQGKSPGLPVAFAVQNCFHACKIFGFGLFFLVNIGLFWIAAPSSSKFMAAGRTSHLWNLRNITSFGLPERSKNVNGRTDQWQNCATVCLQCCFDMCFYNPSCCKHSFDVVRRCSTQLRALSPGEMQSY